MRSWWRTKSLEQLRGEIDEPGRSLKRALGPVDLITLGVGAVVGAGIFATIGTAAAGDTGHVGAGPAIVVSFLVTAVACGFAALCYAEFASMIPVAGSAYTYSYATLGELVAWIIGWDLLLEYAIGNVAVAVSWAGYFKELLGGLRIPGIAPAGIHIPVWLANNYRAAVANPEILATAPRLFSLPIVVNFPAILITALVTWVLVIGIKESSRFNSAMVAVKLLVLAFFVLVGVFYIRPENWSPFAPNGWEGIGMGAALIFFAYIGFDAVSTAAEETRDPERNLPIGILGTLVVCTLIYVAVALVLTGLVPATELGTAEPLATAFSRIGLNWAAGIVSLGAVVATTAVLLVFQLGQPRICFSMARDGLLPQIFARIHPRYRTPVFSTVLTGVVVGFLSAFSDIGWLVELTNIGTLFAFVLVSIGVLVLRRTQPDRRRPFRCPGVPKNPWLYGFSFPALSVYSCAYLMTQLPGRTWWRFVVWLAAGAAIYLFYGMGRSVLRRSSGGSS
jgi:APA family basic amino acid/polyamine antiporter